VSATPITRYRISAPEGTHEGEQLVMDTAGWDADPMRLLAFLIQIGLAEQYDTREELYELLRGESTYDLASTILTSLDAGAFEALMAGLQKNKAVTS
jgi:hypothetical protein